VAWRVPVDPYLADGGQDVINGDVVTGSQIDVAQLITVHTQVETFACDQHVELWRTSHIPIARAAASIIDLGVAAAALVDHAPIREEPKIVAADTLSVASEGSAEADAHVASAPAAR
tara:strand:- start:1021 stop:1371 length:351 start_codon:yes stop_codon:yes gene_type:complete